MTNEDAVAGLWHSLMNRLWADPRVTFQLRGYLSLVEPAAVLGEILYIDVPNDIIKGVIEQRLLGIVHELMETNSEFGGPIRIEISVNPGLEGVQRPATQDWVGEASAPSVPGAQQPNTDAPAPDYLAAVEPAEVNQKTRLNPKYTFDTFVTGTSNRFAHAAALAVAEDPAKAYNPLFIYGSSGLGKTHLLHAIGHYTITLNPRRKVRYVSSEEFTNDFINSISANRNQEFQSEYRDIDMLLIDDIQFLEGKEQTQEAFFHLFNALHNNNKQVVITSDQPPPKMQGFEERLLTRFEWGLMSDIQVPELETRIAILRKRAESEKIRVPDDILSYIAERVRSNVRELEGTLNRLTAYANLNRQPITMQLVQTVLRDVVVIDEQGYTPAQIMATVADFYKINQDDLSGKSRAQAIAQARQIAMYLCREMTSLSLPKIGDIFEKDHTTVLYACQKIKTDMNRKREIYTHVTEIINRIKNNSRV